MVIMAAHEVSGKHSKKTRTANKVRVESCLRSEVEFLLHVMLDYKTKTQQDDVYHVCGVIGWVVGWANETDASHKFFRVP